MVEKTYKNKSLVGIPPTTVFGEGGSILQEPPDEEADETKAEVEAEEEETQES